MTSGRYLTENAGDGQTATGQPTFPVLAAASSGLGEYTVTRVQRLPSPRGPVILNTGTMASEASVPGPTVLTTTISARQAYGQALAAHLGEVIDAYWTAGPTSYERGGAGTLPGAGRAAPGGAGSRVRAAGRGRDAAGRGARLSVPRHGHGTESFMSGRTSITGGRA